MAVLNGIYIFVENEQVTRNNEVTAHPTEKGLPLTDNSISQPKTISLSGKIVDTDQYKAETIIEKIDKLRTDASLITYKGRNNVGNYMITSFNTSNSNTVWGGAEFDMEIVEIRIGKTAYNPTKSAKPQSQKNTPNLSVGATVVFTGGSVYVSSDAKTAAAKKERQTCKITKINTKSWATHQYHLISTETVYPYNVYGWVDKSNIEGTGTAGTAAVTNAGTQQVKSSSLSKKDEFYFNRAQA